MASVLTVLMTAMSSEIEAMFGIRSLNHCPLLPCWANLNRDFTTGSELCPEVMPVMRWPMRMLAGSSFSWNFSSIGL